MPDHNQVPSGEFSDWAIPDQNLTEDLVPPLGATWPEMFKFALSFDGYAYRGNELGPWANSVAGQFGITGAVDPSLSLPELRALLFFEQRRFHHFGTEPAGPSLAYWDALLAAIRAGARVTRVGSSEIVGVEVEGEDE